MNRSPLAVLAAIAAAAITFYASSAEAGLRIRLGFGGPLPAFTAVGPGHYGARHYHRERYIERRYKKKTHVAKPKAPAPKVVKRDRTEKKVTAKPEKTIAKSEKIAKVDIETPETVDAENSSIAANAEPLATNQPAEVKPADQEAKGTVTPAIAAAPQPKPAKAASKLDCKKFFPSVGMTLTVPCE